jgi:hypothetical protein
MGLFCTAMRSVIHCRPIASTGLVSVTKMSRPKSAPRSIKPTAAIVPAELASAPQPAKQLPASASQSTPVPSADPLRAANDATALEVIRARNPVSECSFPGEEPPESSTAVARLNALSVRAIDRCARVGYEAVGEALEDGFACLGSAIQAQDIATLVILSADYANRIAANQRIRAEELAKLATASQSALSQWLCELLAGLESTARRPSNPAV